MKFDMSVPFYTDEMKAIFALTGQEPPKDDGKTIMNILANLLIASVGDERASPTEKGQRWSILCRLRESSLVELTIEDVAMIKKLIDASSAVLGHGRLTEFLNKPIPDPPKPAEPPHEQPAA